MASAGSLTGLDLRAEIDRLRTRDATRSSWRIITRSPRLQDIADFVGDSLDLRARRPATDADVIAFCGVRFMAETAKILSPAQDRRAARHGRRVQPGGQLPARAVRRVPRAHPDHIALTYINCSTEVKALCDIIVTSLVGREDPAQIPADQKIIFGPDRISAAISRARPGATCCCGPACASSTRRSARPNC